MGKNKFLTFYEVEAWANDELDDSGDREDLYFNTVITPTDRIEDENYENITSLIQEVNILKKQEKKTGSKKIRNKRLNLHEKEVNKQEDSKNYYMSLYEEIRQTKRIYNIAINKLSEYSLGQRWISLTEPNLGLGTMIDFNHKIIILEFKQANKIRTYRIKESPIVRVKFQAGDIIHHIDGKKYTINSFRENNKIIYYQIKENNKHKTEISETLISDFTPIEIPRLRLSNKIMDKYQQFYLRYRTYLQQIYYKNLNVRGFLNPRIELWPHQISIADCVTSLYRPRAILADEIGLGKTLEAGLILYKLITLEEVNKVLLLIPSHLCTQWIIEMKKRFNLAFTWIDNTYYQSINEDNPFEEEQLIICSVDFVANNKNIQNQIINACWDMIVIDEAHYLIEKMYNDYLIMLFMKQISKKSKGLLLISGTPEQLGEECFFTCLNLLDPVRFCSINRYKKEKAHYKDIATITKKILKNECLQNSDIDKINLIINHDNQAKKEIINYISNKTNNKNRIKLAKQLIDLYGTSRILFRNSRNKVSKSKPRVVIPLAFDLPLKKHSKNLNKKEFTECKTNNYINHNPLFENSFYASNKDWYNEDPRVNWLECLLKKNLEEKFLLICSHVDTATKLYNKLDSKYPSRSALFHQYQSLITRDRAAASFSYPSGAQILICSEIGSEGRNFQFANHIILFDIPHHPDIIDQRIGRVDRIGQEKNVYVYVPYFKNTSQEKLFKWFNDGLNIFAQYSSANLATYNVLSCIFLDLVKSSSLEEFNKFITKTKELKNEIFRSYNKHQNFLFQSNTFNREKANDIIKKINSEEDNINFFKYCHDLFNEFGVDIEEANNGIYSFNPRIDLEDEILSELIEEKVFFTYNRQIALIREDLKFITRENAIIKKVMERFINSVKGISSVSKLNQLLFEKLKSKFFIELIYICDVFCPQHDELNKYFSQKIIRIFLDDRGENLAHKISIDKLVNKLCSVEKKELNEFYTTNFSKINLILEKSSKIVEAIKEQERNKQLENANIHLNNELTRLKNIKSINTNVEIKKINSYLKKINKNSVFFNIRLDAIHIIIS